MRLETNRLLLMSTQFTDANDIFMGVKESVNELSTWFPWAIQSYNLRQAQEFIAEAIKKSQNQEAFVYTVKSRSSGKFMGIVELKHVPDVYGRKVPMFEVGAWIRNSEAGQGYGAEALKKLIEHADQTLKAKRVFAETAASNSASIKMMQEAGLTKEAELKHNRVLPDGSLENTVIWSWVK
ncbi:MAG: hypothetical protein COY40_06170 [Alphaproteobacteria bacterium CG_4_10_14_0_8_um_filter_53_9]|nr:MAG: hypothetical protein COY40_06170 [Alphaproteobacteria bacterium CG_4_10_14_0_8_um_filter_53_9]